MLQCLGELSPSIPKGQSYCNRCPSRFFHKEAWESSRTIWGGSGKVRHAESLGRNNTVSSNEIPAEQYFRHAPRCENSKRWSTSLFGVTFHHTPHTKTLWPPPSSLHCLPSLLKKEGARRKISLPLKKENLKKNIKSPSSTRIFWISGLNLAACRKIRGKTSLINCSPYLS